MNILCVTPNVAIDRLISVPVFAAGGVWRAKAARLTCGGKGVNVARALRHLGHDSVCAGLIGGESGCRAADEARAEGLSTDWTWIDGETRTCVVIVDDRGTATVVNEPGPVVEASDWSRLVADIEAAARETKAVCICGSLPQGVASDGLARLVAAASADGRPVWVDTGGDALRGALYAVPSGVKINGDEAAALLGEAVTTVPAAVRAARLLSESGATRAVVTMAAAGAVLADGDGTWLARPPPLPAVNTVASGDAFLAGLLAGFADGLNAAEALRLAAATGAANTQSLGLADIDVAVVMRLRARTTVEAVAGSEG
jgi:1-phosphofructokinase family hexose kinase